jgi:entericidin A
MLEQARRRAPPVAFKPEPPPRFPWYFPATAKEIPMKRLIALMLLALFSTGTLTACNTMAGVGEDVEAAGEAIEEEAVEEQND